MKFVPLMVIAVPGAPVAGEKLEIVGTRSRAPLMKNDGDILKKMFPTASTLIRAKAPAEPGTVTVSEPSLGVLFARIIGKEDPSSRESVILTVLQLTGALFVLATFQVTVCCVPTFHVPG